MGTRVRSIAKDRFEGQKEGSSDRPTAAARRNAASKKSVKRLSRESSFPEGSPAYLSVDRDLRQPGAIAHG